jgi:hypothetical protein
MHQQYVRTIDKFERIGEKNEYRLSNPEICDAVVGLPKMLDEAAAARKIIKEAEDEAVKRKSDITS